MTENLRVIALQQAVATAGLSGEEGSGLVLELANQFHAFLTSGDAPAAASAAPAAPAPSPAKPKAAKPKAAPKPEPTPEPEASDEDEAEEAEETAETSADDVKGAISNLIGIGQRDELVNLLKKFKATSFSGIKTADYAKFVTEANQIAANAKLAQ